MTSPIGDTAPALEDHAAVEDDLWHLIEDGDDVAAVVDGAPLITLCGMRMPDAETGEIEVGPASGERVMCRRCESVRVRFMPDRVTA